MEGRLAVEQGVGGLEGLVRVRHVAGLVLVDADRVGRGGDQVLLREVRGVPEGVELALVRLRELDQIADAESHGVALDLDEGVQDVVAFKADHCLGLRIGLLRQPSGVVVVLEVGARLGGGRGSLLDLRILGPRLRVVVAAQDGELARIEGAGRGQGPEVLLGPMLLLLFGLVEDGLVAGDRSVGRGRVGHDQGVRLLRVPEEVVDAVLLEEALDEVEIGLSVLHRVLARPVGGVLQRTRLDVGELAVGEDLRHMGGGVAIEEDATVAGVVEDTQLGVQDGQVAGVPHGHTRLGEVGDDAVEVAGGAAVELDAHRERLPEDLVEGDVPIRGEEGEVVAVGAT